MKTKIKATASVGDPAELLELFNTDLVAFEEIPWGRYAECSETELIKMYALLVHYGIDSRSPDAWFHLALNLARETVPGVSFNEKKTRGAPKKWGLNVLCILHVEIDDLVKAE